MTNSETGQSIRSAAYAAQEKAKVLVVDDEPRLVRLVSEILKAAGYRVISAANAKGATEAVALEQPDLVLLDVLLGAGSNGYDVCRTVREFSDVAVVMLTAKATEADVLAGFEAGADDYLTKPFSAKELLARVQAVLRRTQRPGDAVTSGVVCGDLEINYARRTVRAARASRGLTRTEFELLYQLARNLNKVMSHVDLLTNVWGPEYRDDLEYLPRLYPLPAQEAGSGPGQSSVHRDFPRCGLHARVSILRV